MRNTIFALVLVLAQAMGSASAILAAPSLTGKINFAKFNPQLK